MSSELVFTVLAGVVTAAVFAYRSFSKQSAETKLQRIVLVQDLARSAWLAVEGFAPNTVSTLDDKVAAALKKVAETLSAQTGKPLSAGEAAVAKLQLEAQAAKATLASLGK